LVDEVANLNFFASNAILVPADSQVTATVFCNEADAALKAFSH